MKQLVPTRVGETRWLPHTLRAMNNVWSLYPALEMHLSQVKRIPFWNRDYKKALGQIHVEKNVFYQTVNSFLNNYCYTLCFFQVKEEGQSVDAKARAKGYHNKLTSRTVVEFGHFLWDVVISLSRLSLFFQTRDSSVADVAMQLEAQVAVLENLGRQ